LAAQSSQLLCIHQRFATAKGVCRLLLRYFSFSLRLSAQLLTVGTVPSVADYRSRLLASTPQL